MKRERRGTLVELPSGLTLQPVLVGGIVGVEWSTRPRGWMLWPGWCYSYDSEMARDRWKRFAQRFSGFPATMREAAERIRAFAEKEASR